MDRRTFLSWVGIGWIATSLPVAIAACGREPESAQNTSTETTASPPQGDGFQTLGTAAELEQQGQILNKQLSVLVVETDSTLSAVNPTCTHRGCTVEWQADQKMFVCPCHGAKYGPKGTVTSGPATKPLKTYEAKLEGDAVLVKMS